MRAVRELPRRVARERGDERAPRLQRLQLQRRRRARAHGRAQQHHDWRQVAPHVLACSVRQGYLQVYCD